MDGMVFALLFAITAALYGILRHFDRAQLDPREPPVVFSRIPLFGHIIGLVRYGSHYFEIIR